MIVYKYDESGFYTGEHKCRPDPLDGVFAMPPNSTEKEPNIKDSFHPKWNGTKWTEIVDKRGVDVWNKASGQKIKNNKINVSDDYTEIEKPTVYHVWRSNKWTEDIALKAEHEAKQKEAADEILIQNKLRQIAIDALIVDGLWTE